MATYTVNDAAVARCAELIEKRQYVRTPTGSGAAERGRRDGVPRAARVGRTGLIACVYRAAEWRHKARAAYELLQRLDAAAGIT